MFNQSIIEGGDLLSIVTDLASGTTGWLPPVQIADGQVNLRGIQALAAGAGANFTLEIWGTCFSSADGTAPVGFWKLSPVFVAAETTEFPGEASNLYLFDVPLKWMRIKVVSLIGTLNIKGVA